METLKPQKACLLKVAISHSHALSSTRSGRNIPPTPYANTRTTHDEVDLLVETLVQCMSRRRSGMECHRVIAWQYPRYSTGITYKSWKAVAVILEWVIHSVREIEDRKKDFLICQNILVYPHVRHCLPCKLPGATLIPTDLKSLHVIEHSIRIVIQLCQDFAVRSHRYWD